MIFDPQARVSSSVGTCSSNLCKSTNHNRFSQKHPTNLVSMWIADSYQIKLNLSRWEYNNKIKKSVDSASADIYWQFRCSKYTEVSVSVTGCVITLSRVQWFFSQNLKNSQRVYRSFHFNNNNMSPASPPPRSTCLTRVN